MYAWADNLEPDEDDHPSDTDSDLNIDTDSIYDPSVPLPCRECVGFMAKDDISFGQVICGAHVPAGGSCEKCLERGLLCRPVMRCREQLYILLHGHHYLSFPRFLRRLARIYWAEMGFAGGRVVNDETTSEESSEDEGSGCDTTRDEGSGDEQDRGQEALVQEDQPHRYVVENPVTPCQ